MATHPVIDSVNPGRIRKRTVRALRHGISFVVVLIAAFLIAQDPALADSHAQQQRANANPQIELMDAQDVQYLEAFTAPGSIFHGSFCDPPHGTDSHLCTKLPLDYNKPFTAFPVALRFYDKTDAKSVAQFRITSRRDIHDSVETPHFFLLDMHHGKLDVSAEGEASYQPVGLEVVPVLTAGEHYRSSMVIAKQQGGGMLTFQSRIVVPKGTVLFRPVPLGMADRERKWRKCDGENVPGRMPSGWMHRYRGAEECGARFVVNLYGERSKREVTSYIFRRVENFNVGPLYRRLNQSFRISPKDPPGLYTLEWWYAGKLLTRTRFEVKG
jgi:hypothetical protein